MIAWMINRNILPALTSQLDDVPAVVLLGPRQVGKTTLALRVGEDRGALYLDLESELDRAKLDEAELYLSDHLGRLVILDGVNRTPGLLPVLSSLIDRARGTGHRSGLYLLLGSASLDSMKQSAETLAGRISHLELTPFTILETPEPRDRLWLRGGFPESYLAEGKVLSFRWREAFVLSYLERDIPQLGPRIAAKALRRFWTMLAHHQGGLLNVAQLARNVGVDQRTAAGYMDLFVDLLLVRRLPAWHANGAKRLVRSPKVYVRDSGLLHALLAIENKDALLGHPVVGASWEGFVIENLLSSAPPGVPGYFYRTSGGAEIDLLLVWPDGRLWAVDVKRSLAPQPDRGFHAACEDLQPELRFIVYPGTETYAVAKQTTVVPLEALAGELAAHG
jgi:predicted AAA+ superfamily ATPase